MANPETTSHLDDEKPQLKVERKEVKRKPNNIEWQNDEVKNIESENADLELLFQTVLLDLRETFPSIPEDLTNKSYEISKWEKKLCISKLGDREQIAIYSNDNGIKKTIMFTKLRDWYDFLSLKQKWKEAPTFDRNTSGFENIVSYFTENPSECNFETKYANNVGGNMREFK